MARLPMGLEWAAAMKECQASLRNVDRSSARARGGLSCLGILPVSASSADLTERNEGKGRRNSCRA